MALAEFAALGAATCWALGGLFSVAPVKAIGPIAFVRIRMCVVVTMLVAYLLVTNNFSSALLTISTPDIFTLILSGIVGIWFGDMMIFLTMDRLGPRRTSMLFATNAPMQVLLGVVFLGETMTQWQVIGCILVMSGIFFAIVYGKRASQVHHWESVRGLLIVGIIFGLGSGLGQAVGSLIAKPVMDKGTSAAAAVIVRGLAAITIFYLSLWLLPIPHQQAKSALTPKLWVVTTISGLLGMSLGMSLLLYAMGHGNLGKVAILSSLSPVLMLPMLWLKTKEHPAIGAWVGAALAVCGVVLLK